MAAIALAVPLFFLYSPRVEQNRIVTITKPLVITQERKTPAYYLYQQTQVSEKAKVTPPAMTTFLSNQNYVVPQTALAVNEMKVSRREIASDVDAGFTSTTVVAEKMAETTKLIPIKTEPPTQLSPSAKWATVRGKFESRGIGFINQYIELKRIEEGQVRELGRVDLNAGLYSIDIESPAGYLVAEVKDRNGTLIGKDIQKIINLQSRGPYYEGPFIQVKQPASIAGNPQMPPTKTSLVKTIPQKNVADIITSLFSNQNILENPTDEYTNVSSNASTISYISDQSKIYRKVLTIRQTGDANKTPLFSEKWIQGLLEYISDQQQIEYKSNNVSILIGRVLVDNKPVAGAQVQIENQPGVYPIYLDQFMIPNSKQTETAENGYFMFIGLEENAYSVSAFRQNHIIGHQMFIAQESAVSFQNISTLTASGSVVVRAFDAFSTEPVDIDFSTPDLEEIQQTVVGTSAYRKQNNLGVTQFNSRTNNPLYIPIKYFQDARKEFVHIPQIQEPWLKQIQTEKLINEMPDSGLFIGFVPDFDYEVFLVYEGYTKDQIVYFDMQGRISPVPVKGGGFILFNVPLNAHEVVVQEVGSDKIFSQVFEVKTNQVSVSHFTESN